MSPASATSTLLAIAALVVTCTPLVGSAPAPDATTDAPDAATDALDAATDAANAPDQSDSACPPGDAAPGARDPERSRVERATRAWLHVRGATRGPDGAAYVYGGTQLCRGPDYDGAVVRFTADGALDTTFGDGGRACVGVGERDEFLMDVALDAAGNLVVAGVSYVPTQPPEQGLVARFDANGRLDTTFSDAAGRRYAYAPGAGLAQTALYVALPDADNVLLVGSEHDPFGASGYGVTLRIRSDGSLDPGFRGGRPWIDAVAAGYSAAVRVPDGYVLAGYGRDARARVVRLGRDGQLVASFGDRGVATLDREGSFMVRALVADARGGYVVGGGYLAPGDTGTPSVALARFTADGHIDTAFGDQGFFIGTALVDNGYQLHADLAADCAGRLLVGASTGSSPALLRVTPQGALDTTFGAGGAARVTLSGVVHGPMAALAGSDGSATLVTNAADNRSVGLWRFFE